MKLAPRVAAKGVGPRTKGAGSLLAWWVAGVSAFTAMAVANADEGGLTFGAFALAEYVAASLLSAAVGGRQWAIALETFCQYVVAATALLVFGLWYAHGIGEYSPLWMIERFLPKDDYNLYQYSILPGCGRPLALEMAQTNAPLFWYGNVWVQSTLIARIGCDVPIAGHMLNTLVGALTVAMIVASAANAVTGAGNAKAGLQTTRIVAVTAPWMLAASVIFIRDIWVYACFALAVRFGVAARQRRPVLRPLILLPTAIVVAWVMFYLRAEMVSLVVLSLIIIGVPVVVPNGARKAILAVPLALAMAAGVAFGGDAIVRDVADTAAVRAEKYGGVDSSSRVNRESTDSGTVYSLVGSSFVARGILQTSWIAIQPLPKVQLKPGSLYAIGKVLRPAWMLGLAIAWSVCFRSVARKGLAGYFLRRHGFALVWIAAIAVAVGFTSAETRHFDCVVPVILLLFAEVVAEAEPGAIHAGVRRGVSVGGGVLVGCVMITLSVFGLSGLLPPF